MRTYYRKRLLTLFLTFGNFANFLITVKIEATVDPWLIVYSQEESVFLMCTYSVRSLCVARSTVMGNAKASGCRTCNGMALTFSITH